MLQITRRKETPGDLVHLVQGADTLHIDAHRNAGNGIQRETARVGQVKAEIPALRGQPRVAHGWIEGKKGLAPLAIAEAKHAWI